MVENSKLKSSSKWQVGGLLLAVLPALLAVDPAWAKVGIASVVNGEPTAKPPAENERVLHIGNDMVANETVTTKANDRAHLVFLDGSTLTVGPNSVITIDKFVYDPDKKTGQLSMDAGRGVFRYVGGAISKNSEVTIKTRGATMGIRGGIATFSVAPNGQTTANFLFGRSMSVSGQGVTQTTTTPGTQISVPPGGAPTPPTPIPPGTMQQMGSFFQGPPGNTGDGPGITAALGRFGASNSNLPPGQASQSIPSTQQAQLNVNNGGQGGEGGQGGQGGEGGQGGSQQASGPQQGNGPQQGGDPNQGGLPPQNSQQAFGAQQGAGPVESGSPLQGAGPESGGGPLESASSTESGGPLQASGPLQAAGPLQNAGPLAAAGPLQQTGPVSSPGELAFGGQPPGPGMPFVPVNQTDFVPALVAGNPTALQQLQNLLGSPEGTTPQTLQQIVNNVTPPTPPSPSPTPTFTPTFFPTPSPPTVFNPPTTASVSPN